MNYCCGNRIYSLVSVFVGVLFGFVRAVPPAVRSVCLFMSCGVRSNKFGCFAFVGKRNFQGYSSYSIIIEKSSRIVV